MLFSYNKLHKMANLKNVSVEKMSDALNKLGFEVEGFTEWIKANDKIIIGKIIELKKHPKADRLLVLKIATKTKNFQIVTSASVYLNDVIAFFEPHAIIDGIELKPKKFFGVESFGMVTSWSELGIFTDVIPDYWPEIVTLNSEAVLGEPLINYLDLQDFIIDIDILYNRSDANCYSILAKELAAFFQTAKKEAQFNSQPSFISKIKVTNGEANHLSMFEAKVSKIIKSDFETELLLMKSNIKPINEIVDLTALSALMWNQPMHAYDLDKIGSSVTVKTSSGNADLLNNQHIAFENILCVISNQTPICLAGVMGFSNFSVTEKTSRILFEVANFSIKDIRLGLKKLKIESDSAFRFSRAINLNIISKAIAFVQSKLSNYSQVINPIQNSKKEIKCNLIQFQNYLSPGFLDSSKTKTAIKKLKDLDFQFENLKKIIIPFYRNDLDNTEDMIEEVLRFTGYDSIVKKAPKIVNHKNVQSLNNVENALVTSGFTFVKSYALTNSKSASFNPFLFSKNVYLKTYLSTEKNVYRNSLSYSLLEIGLYNQKRKIYDIGICEIGKIHGEAHDHLALVSNCHENNDNYPQIFKRIIENLFSNYGEIKYQRSQYKHLHPGLSCDIYLNENKIGFIGKIHPAFLAANEFWMCEVSLALITKNTINKIAFQPFENQSFLIRDFTISLQSNTSYNEIQDKFKQFSTVAKIKLIDSYHNNNVNNLTFRVFFCNNSRTKQEITELESINLR